MLKVLINIFGLLNMFHTIKQLEEKNVASEVTSMVWSNRMDLVALANIKGEVALHRLTWTRAWILNPPKEGTTVNGIAWRPDGKVLAVAYSHGIVLLINIETKAIITTFEITGEASFISWVQEKPLVKPKNIFKLNEDDNNAPKFIDLSKPYLKDPPPVSHLEGSINFEDIKGLTSFLQDQSEFNLLVIGTKDGTINMRVFGCWKCLTLNVNDCVGYQCSIQNVHFTEDLSKLFVTVTNLENNVNTIIFNADIFKSHSAELYHVTMKYIKMYELILYLGKILTSITETWESILLEIDKKLSKYASQVPEGGVTADFLDLLMFGYCSERIEEFLIHDLTKKGLEKFGQTMEVSYSNIQSYLFRHIIKFSQNGTFHLSELNGMAKFKEKYGIIGLSEEQIQKAIQSNGAFVIKAGEMQQIINHSVINYKAFFRWLYASIMNLMEEPIPSDIQKMTQQDLACITEFLQNFDNYGQDKKDTRFIMERLGQYLVDADLTIKPDVSGNDWTQFLEENECLKSNPNILTHYINKSLIQVFNELKSNVDKVFESPLDAIGKQVVPVSTFNCFNFGTNSIIISSLNISSDMLLFAFLKPTKSVYLLQVHINENFTCQARCGNFFFSQNFTEDSEPVEEMFDVIDTRFYSSTILSVLLQESLNPRRGVIFQFPLSLAFEKLKEICVTSSLKVETIPSINGSCLGQKIYKNIEMSVSQFSVSGSRRVSIVLAENKRKVKLFEMECEEDEEEDAEMSLIKEDVSMQDSFPAASTE